MAGAFHLGFLQMKDINKLLKEVFFENDSTDEIVEEILTCKNKKAYDKLMNKFSLKDIEDAICKNYKTNVNTAVVFETLPAVKLEMDFL